MSLPVILNFKEIKTEWKVNVKKHLMEKGLDKHNCEFLLLLRCVISISFFLMGNFVKRGVFWINFNKITCDNLVQNYAFKSAFPKAYFKSIVLTPFLEFGVEESTKCQNANM